MRSPISCTLLFIGLALAAAPVVQAEEFLVEDDFDSEDMFNDAAFTDEDTDALLAQAPFELWWQHGLVYDPSSFTRPANQDSELHLEAETTLGLSGYADVDIKASQNWVSGEFDAQVASATVQLSTQQGAFKLGRYINSWGEVEGAGVLDIINPAPGLTDTSRAFKPEWLVGYNHYMGPKELQVLANVDPQVTATPGITRLQSSTKEWGMRYKATGSGSDWAVYMGQFVQNAPVLGIVNSLPTLQANAYELFGYSYNRAKGDDLIKFDVAWKSGLAHYASGSFTAVDRLDMALGAEINDGDRQWMLSLVGNYLPDHQATFQQVAINPVTMMPSIHAVDAWSASYSLGISDSFANDEFSWNLMTSGAINGNFGALLGELTWGYSDDVTWRFYAAGMQAKAGTAYAAMDGFQRLGVQFEQHF
ncbi:MAG TPA: hypothetical protein DE179_01965 [Oceanospirillaceae bacterium]|nr:hypothetical protein [Oceanospirillaceae bacterium]